MENCIINIYEYQCSIYEYQCSIVSSLQRVSIDNAKVVIGSEDPNVSHLMTVRSTAPRELSDTTYCPLMRQHSAQRCPLAA